MKDIKRAEAQLCTWLVHSQNNGLSPTLQLHTKLKMQKWWIYLIHYYALSSLELARAQAGSEF